MDLFVKIQEQLNLAKPLLNPNYLLVFRAVNPSPVLLALLNGDSELFPLQHVDRLARHR